jgi:hypothetical protein
MTALQDTAPKRATVVRLTEAVYDWLRDYAHKNGTTQSAVTERALLSYRSEEGFLTINYTVEVTQFMRAAINEYYGRGGIASDEDVRTWYEQFGRSQDDDLSLEPSND